MRASWRLAVIAAVLIPSPVMAQGLGHKLPGSAGLDAGTQAPAGLYVAGRFAHYSANRLVDREGRTVPAALELDASAGGVGVAGILEVPSLGIYVSAAFALPLARLSVGTENPTASIDRFGLADVYVQPLQLGWRGDRFSAIASYALYIPSGKFAFGSAQDGVSSGHLTQQVSIGGTIASDAEQTGFVSARASYDNNRRKRGIDITRGDILQIQGGAGATLLRIVKVGIVGYALWQVRDDRGSDLPDVLRGARDRVYGLGPEISVVIPSVRAQLSLRYEHDLGARARPDGQIVVLTATFIAWQPSSPKP